MHNILNQLVLDHMQLERVLILLKRQIRRYADDNDEVPDLNVIRDIIEYIRCYPDTFHHPLEEVILDRLMDRVKDIEVRSKLEFIRNDHATLARLTSELAARIEAVARDQVVSVNEIVDAFTHYYELQMKHIDYENRHFFPLIGKLFSERELEAITADIPHRADPLFSARKAEFEELYRFILENEENHR